jgi:hypothetical protein
MHTICLPANANASLLCQLRALRSRLLVAPCHLQIAYSVPLIFCIRTSCSCTTIAAATATATAVLLLLLLMLSPFAILR